MSDYGGRGTLDPHERRAVALALLGGAARAFRESGRRLREAEIAYEAARGAADTADRGKQP